MREIAKQHPERFPDHWHLALEPIIWTFQENTGRTLKLLLAGVVLLLIIGCANCSILLLARGRTRRHELAIRSAIGASRWRIVRQLLVEAIVISCTGAVLGVAASYWLAKLPMVLSPDSFPAESFIRINAPILAFSVALALLCGILFGLVPALRLSRARFRAYAPRPADRRCGCSCKASLERSHRRASRAHAASHGHCGNRHPQLSWADADAAWLRSRKCHEARHHSRTSTIQASGRRIQSRQARVAYIEQIRDKIASVPGISTVAVGADATPPYAGVSCGSFEIDGTGDREQPQARVMLVDQRYFATLRISLLQGRIWNTDENNRGDFIAVVNHAFATRYLSSSNAVGRQLRIPGLTPRNRYQVASAQSTAWRQIIGVVGDARNDGLDRPVVPAIYLPYTTLLLSYAQFFVRTQGDPLTYLHSIRAAIASVASDQQISTAASTALLP